MTNTLQVRSAEGRAKADAACQTLTAAAHAQADVELLAIETKASLLKSTIICRTAPAFAAIATEMIARHEQGTLQLRAVQGEGHKQQVILRHNLRKEMEALAAQGMMTNDELAEMQGVINDFMVGDMASLANAVQRTATAIDMHAARATDHIASEQNKYK